MKTSIILYSTFLLSFLNSDSKLTQQIYGIWEAKAYDKGVLTFVKKKKIKNKRSAYFFKENEVLFERWEMGVCGSEKTSYKDNENGKWYITKDSVLTITYNFTKIVYKKRYKLLSVSDEKLNLKILEPIEIKKTSL